MSKRSLLIKEEMLELGFPMSLRASVPHDAKERKMVELKRKINERKARE
jgi:hypothetical protein